MRVSLLMLFAAFGGVIIAAVGCGSTDASPSSASSPAPSANGDERGPNNNSNGAGPSTSIADAGPSTIVADANPATSGTYRTSLSICWTDATCPRAMIVAHGGDWTPSGLPYGSMGAVVAAFDHGVEAVKIDVRVTKDNVPVVSHSSPFTAYESIDCYNKRIENMTAADVTKCHFATSSSETFQRLDTMLDYIHGKMIVQLTVKESTDYARAIAEVVTRGAQDFAFFEVGTADLQNLIPTIPKSDQVRYLVNVGANLAEIDLLLGASKNPHMFMIEMDPSAEASAAIASKVHPAGLRAFTYDKSATASQAELTDLFNQGFDVVSANATANNLKARIAVNTSRGVSPP